MGKEVAEMNVRKYVAYGIRNMSSIEKFGNMSVFYVEAYDSGLVGKIEVVTDPDNRGCHSVLSQYDIWLKNNGKLKLIKK